MSWAVLTILAGGIATLAIYSFLIKENSFYRLFEYLFIGIAAGFGPVFVFKNFLWPKVLEPMLGLNISYYPDGTSSEPYSYGYLLFLFPMAFGLLYYTLYSKRYSWLAKLVIGFSLGYSGGLAFKGFFAEMMPQLVGSFRPLIVIENDFWSSFGATVENWIFLLTLLSVMYYFFFTFRFARQSNGTITLTGRWLMMICFGAFFGSTVMARMALLVERLQFLIVDWWTALTGLIL